MAMPTPRLTGRRVFALLLIAVLAAVPQAAALTFHAGGTFGNTSATVTLTAPASTLANDVLIAGIAFRGGSGTSIAAPPGWTLISRTDSGTTISLATYYVVATAGASTHDWTLG